MPKKIFSLLITGVIVFSVSKLSFAMMCAGQSQHQQTAQAEPREHQHEAATQATKKAVDAGNKICPVSGDKINEETKATYEYEGKIYNFCCPMCIEEFKKDPQKYIEKVGEELQKKGEILKEAPKKD